MQRLKAHPREESGNRFILKRAERVYQELGGDERILLSQLMDGFEAALAMQDNVAIESNREALEEFLDRIDPASEGPEPDLS